MNPPAATLAPQRPTAVVADPVRRGTLLAGGVLVLLLAVNLPAFLRTALDCDPIVFDLYVRDAARGRVLYRDMLENNTPAMIWAQAAVRGAFGWSSEALRAVDLVVVGAGIGLLARWFHPGRPDRRLFAAAVLGSLYLTTSEWCHCQRDVWLTLPVLGALYLRRGWLKSNLTPRPPLRSGEGERAGVNSHPWPPTSACLLPLSASERGPGGEVRTATHFGRSLLEGVVWGLAVWLKPHMVLVAFAVWLTGVALARGRGASRRTITRDLLGLLAGGLLVGAAGVAAMMAAGVWWPYLAHLTTWAGEYPGADMYGPYGRWLFRLAAAWRNLPWSVLYLVALPAAAVAAAGPFLGRRVVASPERALLGAALTAWAAQAFLLQHVFDYVHVPAVLLAVALLLDVAAGRVWPTVALGLIAVAAHATVFAERAAVWRECLGPPTPALRDKLARFDRLHWVHLHAVADFLAAENSRDGEVSVLSDTALPLYTLTGLAAPTRYYIPRNNLLAYRSRQPEILAALAAVPGQRFAVYDLAAVWQPPAGRSWADRDDWPLAVCLGRWADRVVFRAGRYVVLAVPAADGPAFLAEVSEF